MLWTYPEQSGLKSLLSSCLLGQSYIALISNNSYCVSHSRSPSLDQINLQGATTFDGRVYRKIFFPPLFPINQSNSSSFPFPNRTINFSFLHQSAIHKCLSSIRLSSQSLEELPDHVSLSLSSLLLLLIIVDNPTSKYITPKQKRHAKAFFFAVAAVFSGVFIGDAFLIAVFHTAQLSNITSNWLSVGKCTAQLNFP